MNKINNKGVKEGIWTYDGVNCNSTCFYDGIPVVDPVFGFQQSHMQGRWERHWKFEFAFSFDIGFMNTSVLDGECISILL